MTKRIVLLSISIVAMMLAVSCTKTPTAQLTGTIESVSNDTTDVWAYIYRANTEQTKLDSVKLNKGAFTFNIDLSDTLLINCPAYLIIEAAQVQAAFFLENGQLTFNAENQTVTGTPLNDDMAKMKAYEEETYKAFENELKEKGLDMQSEDDMPQIEELYNQMQVKTKAFYWDMLKEHRNDELGANALASILYNQSLTQDDLAVLQKDFAETIAKDKRAQGIITTKENFFKLQKGAMFVDFDATNINGEAVKLSDYVGKGQYTLVDFFASWCKPCMLEIPHIAKAYNTFKGKGLNVVGIFVWDKKENLQPTIDKMKMTWPIIIEEKDGTSQYGISGIPQIILFDPDGKIVSRELRGEAISKKLSEIYK